MSNFHSSKFHTFDAILTLNVHCFELSNLATSRQQQTTLLQCSDWLQRTMDVATENNGRGYREQWPKGRFCLAKPFGGISK